MDTLQHIVTTINSTELLPSVRYGKPLIFFIGLCGILLHNLMRLKRLNKKGAATIDYRAYFSQEIISILISLVFTALYSFALADEVFAYAALKLPFVLGLAGTFSFLIGYCAVSLLSKATGTAEDYIDSLNKPDTDNP